MKAVEKIADFVEGMFQFLGTSLKQSAADYCDIEYTEDERTFVLKDGSRMTLLRVGGARQMIGTHEFDATCGRLATSLQAFMRGGGHALAMVFESDPDAVEREIRESQAPYRATAERVGLELDDLFEEDVRVLSEHCSAERCWIVLYTRPSAFNAADLKRDAEARKELLKANPLPRMTDAPNLFRVIKGLQSRHESFVNSVLSELAACAIAAEVLEVHEAAREMRYVLDRDFTADAWRPSLPGDRIPVRPHRRNPEDASGQIWPRLDRELTPRDIEELDARTVRVGARAYRPMYINRFQSGDAVAPFQDLFKRVRAPASRGGCAS